MKIDWLKIVGTVAIVILVSLILYGAFQFYFSKPVPIVNNTTVQPGATLNVEQNKKVNQQGRLFTGLYGNTREIGLTVGWLW